MRRRSWYRWGGLSLLLVGVICLGVWAASSYRAGRDLYVRMRELQGLASADVTGLDPDAVGLLLHSMRKDTVTLKQNLGWLTPLASRLGWIPKFGPVLAASPDLLDLGDSLTEAGVLLWRDATPLLLRYQAGASATEMVPEAVTVLSPGLDDKIQLIDRAQLSYDRIEIPTLPGRIQGPLTELGQLLPLLGDGLRALGLAPQLLGIGEPRTYLVLALNEDELRPGGGFISGVGEVRIADGRVASLKFGDSYKADDYKQPYPDPPEPLQALMGIDLFVFRDSNWSPDFPTSARQAIELYRPGYEIDPDGVIGVDQYAVRLLAEAIGPVTVPEQAEPVAPEDVVGYMHGAWGPEDGKLDVDWWLQRKGFMEELAKAYFSRVESGSVDLMPLGKAVLKAFETRHIQVYSKDPQTAALLAAKGWDGGVLPRSSDYLLVSEANVGYNKASTSISRHMRYEVDLRDEKIAANLVLQYQHLGEPGGTCNPRSRYDPTYEAMMQRCYWAYVRALVPQDSHLLSASHHPIPSSQVASGKAWPGLAQASTGVASYVQFGQAFLLRKGEDQEVRFCYELPTTVVDHQPDGGLTYRLFVQKQPGIRALNLDVSVRLPENAEIDTVEPVTAPDESGVLSFHIVSETDAQVSITYHIPEE